MKTQLTLLTLLFSFNAHAAVIQNDFVDKVRSLFQGPGVALNKGGTIASNCIGLYLPTQSDWVEDNSPFSTFDFSPVSGDIYKFNHAPDFPIIGLTGYEQYPAMLRAPDTLTTIDNGVHLSVRQVADQTLVAEISLLRTTDLGKTIIDTAPPAIQGPNYVGFAYYLCGTIYHR